MLAILISERIDFKTKAVMGKGRSLYSDKRSTYQGVINHNIYPPIIGATKQLSKY